MKKTLGLLAKAFVIILVIAYMVLIVAERVRYNQNLPMLVVLKEETINYDDGHVYVYWGLGYKTIIYERTSFNGKYFGPFFEKVQDTIPN